MNNELFVKEFVTTLDDVLDALTLEKIYNRLLLFVGDYEIAPTIYAKVNKEEVINVHRKYIY